MQHTAIDKGNVTGNRDDRCRGRDQAKDQRLAGGVHQVTSEGVPWVNLRGPGLKSPCSSSVALAPVAPVCPHYRSPPSSTSMRTTTTSERVEGEAGWTPPKTREKRTMWKSQRQRDAEAQRKNETANHAGPDRDGHPLKTNRLYPEGGSHARSRTIWSAYKHNSVQSHVFQNGVCLRAIPPLGVCPRAVPIPEPRRGKA